MRAFLLALVAPLLLGGTWWVGGGGGGGGGSLLPTALATSTTISNCYGTAYSNGAAGAEITLTLCPAAPGMDVWIVWEDDGQNFHIDPSGSERINAPYTDAGGNKLTWTTPGITNSSIHLYSPSAGEWTVLEMKGSQAVDTN